MLPWQLENAVAGAVAGITTVVSLHPLDVVRTRFQVQDGRDATVPRYRSTANALISITRAEGIKGLYAGLFPALLGSGVSWGMYFFFYNIVKSQNQHWTGKELGAALHLVSAAEAGVFVCFITNPLWVVKTRLQLQNPGNMGHRPYAGFSDAVRNIVKEEGWRALYKGLGPSLLLVSHGSLQFMAYEEGRKLAVKLRCPDGSEKEDHKDKYLKPIDFAVLGGLSKLFATSVTYPYQVIRTRVQQRPKNTGKVKYTSSWHALRETLRYEGLFGLYKGIVPNIWKNVPASSITFFVYEAMLKILH